LDGPLVDGKSYLSGIEKSLIKVSEYIEDDANQDRIEFYREWLDNLVFHLYGFGEQAGQMGDIETQQRSFELANKFFSTEKYQEVVGRRLDKEGKLIMTKEDIT
jgi:hypothetical protein